MDYYFSCLENDFNTIQSEIKRRGISDLEIFRLPNEISGVVEFKISYVGNNPEYLQTNKYCPNYDKRIVKFMDNEMDLTSLMKNKLRLLSPTDSERYSHPDNEIVKK